MELRLPWIFSRRRLLLCMVVDSGLFILLYNYLFFSDYGHRPETSFVSIVLLASWILSSYVIGRYQRIDGCSSAEILLVLFQALIKTLLVISLGVIFIGTYLWLLKADSDTSVFQSFLMHYLLHLGSLSFLLQTFLRLLLRNKKSTDKCYFVGSNEAYKKLEFQLNWSQLPAEVQYLPRTQISQVQDNETVIVEDFSVETLSVLERLFRLQQNGCEVLELHLWCERILQRCPSEFLASADLLRGRYSLPEGSFQLRLKRLADVLVSIFLILLTCPIILIAVCLIKVEDGGPILYSQIRSGSKGNTFRIYKLRSMRIDAEKNGAQWVKRSDSRITKIGSFLRVTRLDELPQLLCVLSGSMSLIGPRPERPEFDEDLSRKISHYNLRYLVRPGLSGWAQVNYPYGSSFVDAKNKLSYDLYYLRNFSFG